jgi:hypothetical protein
VELAPHETNHVCLSTAQIDFAVSEKGDRAAFAADAGIGLALTFSRKLTTHWGDFLRARRKFSFFPILTKVPYRERRYSEAEAMFSAVPPVIGVENLSRIRSNSVKEDEQ